MKLATALLALVLALVLAPVLASPAGAAVEDALVCPGDLRVYAVTEFPLGATLGVSDVCPAGADGRQADVPATRIRIVWENQPAGLADVEAKLHGKGHAGTLVPLAEVLHVQTGTGETRLTYETGILGVSDAGRLDVELYHDGVLVATTFVH